MAFFGLSINSLRAHQSPAGCFANRSSIDIVVLTPCITNGGLARFEIDYENEGGTGGCDVTVTNTQFRCPGPNGLPGATSVPIIQPSALPTTFPFGTPLQFVAFITCKVDITTFSLPDNDVLVRGEFFGPLHANASDTANGGAFKEIPVKVFNPCIDVEQECVNQCTAIGQPIQIRGTVRNCGDEPLVNVTAVNTLAGAQILRDAGGTPLATPVRLAPGQTAFFTGQFNPTGNQCGPFSNTTTARGEPECTGGNRTDSDTDVCHVITRPAISLTKDCRPVAPPCDNTNPRSVRPGEQYTETFVVTNTGDVPLQNVVVHDSVSGNHNCGSGVLNPGQSCTVTVTLTAPANSCAPITDTAFATADNTCPPDAVCPSPANVTSATATCTMIVCCVPNIAVEKLVTCLDPGVSCENASGYSKLATGVRGADDPNCPNDTGCPAFCYKITVTNTGETPLDNVTLVDDNGTPGNTGDDRTFTVPGTLAIGATAAPVFYSSTRCADTHNIVRAVGHNALAAAGTGLVRATNFADVHVAPISVSCAITLDAGSFDTDTRTVDDATLPLGLGAAAGDTLADNNHVTLVNSFTGPVIYNLYITGDANVDLNVAITLDANLAAIPQLAACIAANTPLNVPKGQTRVIQCSLDFDHCPAELTGNVHVKGTAIATEPFRCIYNICGTAVTTAESQCGATVECEVITEAACRVTGGGILLPGNVDHSCIDVPTTIFPSEVNHLTVVKVTHGGQLGAPFAHMDCGAILGNPCIRGQWSHTRHYQGQGNPRDVIDMDFHSTTPKGVYDSLSCACLGCCDPDSGAFIPPTMGGKFKKFELCNPDDHKICGPMPRPSPANAIIWSGVGKIKPETDSGSNQKAAQWVVFRIYIEDRSEPGGNHPGGAVEPADIYCFQAWKTGISVTKRPDFTGIWTDFRRALGEANCAFLDGLKAGAQPIGSLPSPTVNGVTADIQDCGPMWSGNHQIHPVTGADAKCVDPAPTP